MNEGFKKLQSAKVGAACGGGNVAGYADYLIAGYSMDGASGGLTHSLSLVPTYLPACLPAGASLPDCAWQQASRARGGCDTHTRCSFHIFTAMACWGRGTVKWLVNTVAGGQVAPSPLGWMRINNIFVRAERA